MSEDKNETAKGGPKKEVYTFFVSGKKYETDQPALTGLQIKARVENWVRATYDRVLLPSEARPTIRGVVFEVRQGYKSKDSKRQNAAEGLARRIVEAGEKFVFPVSHTLVFE